MTDKQAEAFARSDARRAAQGLPPARPDSASAKVAVSSPKAKTEPPAPGCGGCRSAKQYLEGARKAAKAALTPSEVTREVLDARRATCASCPSAKLLLKRLAATSQCKECGCLIMLKTRLATEACPLGKWPAVDTAATIEGILIEPTNGEESR